MKEKVLSWLKYDFENGGGEVVVRYIPILDRHIPVRVDRYGDGVVVKKCVNADDYIDYVCGKMPLETYRELECVYEILELGSVLSFGEWLDEVFDKVEEGLNPA